MICFDEGLLFLLKNDMKIGIIGLGETGATILALLNQKFSKIEFHVYDPSEWVEGKLLDLRHAAVYKNNNIILNDFAQSHLCTYFFFCAGTRNPKEGDRMDMVRQNKNIIKDVFKNVKPNIDSKIIVLTNPVELISEWIYENLNKAIAVIGTGTGLDAFRLKYILARDLKIDPNEIDIPVVGEHEKSMLPLFSVGKINKKNATDVISFSERKRVTIELRESAKSIRKTEEATKYGVAQCAVDLMECFEQDKEILRFVSYKIPERLFNALNLEYPIFLSLPYLINKNGLKPSSVYSEDLKEINSLRDSAKKIEEYYKELSS